MLIYRAIKFAYRHTWRSGRSGFFRLLVVGWQMFVETKSPWNLHRLAVLGRSKSATHNNSVHYLTQYNNDIGDNVFVATQRLMQLETPSVN